MTTLAVTYEPPIYTDYIIPKGFLQRDFACQALWHYYITAVDNWRKEFDTLVYEGDLDPQFNYKQLFKSVALIYGVEPEKMQQYWSNVDIQCVALRLTKLPDDSRYRFDLPIVVKH